MCTHTKPQKPCRMPATPNLQQKKTSSRDETSLPINQLSDDPHSSSSVTLDNPSDSPCLSSSGKILKSLFPQWAVLSVRYFIMKSSNVRNIDISQQKGIWSTTPSNENKLTKAFMENNLIILIFSVQGSGHFQGVATLPDWLSARPHIGPFNLTSLPCFEVLELAGQRGDFFFANTGRIIWLTVQIIVPTDRRRHQCSSYSGYARMTSAVSQESCQDWGFMGLGGVFSVEWIHKESLPFHCTQQILNPWNDNKKVQISRDGQELEPQAGSQLLSLWERNPRNQVK